jgi:DNA polymerase
VVDSLHIDFETRSAYDLRDGNAYGYFDDPTTDVWLAAYCFGDTEPELWHPGDLCPPEIEDHILAGGEVHAWNAAFERLAIRQILGPRYGWPIPSLSQYRCTMVRAMAMALPGKLEQAAPALGLETVKDAQGSRLMLQMSKPRRPRKGDGPRKLVWWDEPERVRRLGLYCLQDVRTEVAVSGRVLPLSKAEQALWELDQQINDRGVHIDATLCNAAKRLVACTEERLDKEIAKLTDFAVTGVSNSGQLTTWLRSKGLDIPGVAKDVIEGLLVRDDLDPQVRRAVDIRQEGGKTSVAKIDAMLKRRQKDGRMRGNLQFHGASTGRWSGRGAQLQNLPRPSTEDDKQPMIEAILESKDDRLIEALYGNTLTVVSDCIRGMITAAPGNELFVADFSAIEGRVNAWLAGEQRVLDAFAAYDAGEGPDLYKVTASDIYGRPASAITKPERQIGKVGFLALGYGGGPGAFAKMAKGYGLDIAVAHQSVMASATGENVEKARKGWLERGAKSGMSEVRWTTAELIKLAWRQRNPAIVQFWRDLEDGAIEAVQNPGQQVTVGLTGRITYKRVGSFLFCRLPSGRVLTYPYPRIVSKKMPWTDSNGAAVFKDALTYKGVNSVTRQWMEQDFYGGLADENVTQAAARDCMANGMHNTEAAGYPCILTVHDEDIAERKKGEGNLDEFVRLLTKPADWMKGLPLAAEGYVSERYRK